MNNIFGLVILAIFVSYCDTDTISKNSVVPWAPGQCYYENNTYKPGEHKLSGCRRLICSPKGWASVHSCFESPSLEGCIAGDKVDPKQRFPECCKKTYTCQNEDGSEYTMTGF